MKSTSVLRTTTVVACAALVVALWRHWTSTCNEACAPARALSMQWLSIALPASVVWAVFTATAPRSSPLKRLVAGTLVAALVLWGLCISFAP